MVRTSKNSQKNTRRANTVSMSESVKEIARLCSASACGIADASLFGEAPQGFRPENVLKGAKAVISIGIKTPATIIFEAAPTVYTRAIFYLDRLLDEAAFRLAHFLEEKGYRAIPLPGRALNMAAIGGELKGDISHKHAASLAGLGEIGYNSLLLSPLFGNTLALTSVVTDAPLFADSPFPYGLCDNCGRCADACPVKAIQGPGLVDKERCQNHYRMFKDIYKETMGLYFCRECRRVCLERNRSRTL